MEAAPFGYRFELTYCERERIFKTTERLNMESISNGARFELQRIAERALDAHERGKQTGSQLGAVSWLDALRKEIEFKMDDLRQETCEGLAATEIRAALRAAELILESLRRVSESALFNRATEPPIPPCPKCGSLNHHAAAEHEPCSI